MKHCVAFFSTILIFFAVSFLSVAQIVFEVDERIDVEPSWSGHPVRLTLLTTENYQFVAYYDYEQGMVVAQRKIDDTTWTFKRLPENVGWNSHHDVTMIADRDGYLHVSGNMHGVPLVYFRSERPYDVESLVRMSGMTGQQESRVTYPQFQLGPDDELFFVYRYGGAGQAVHYWNVYDYETRTWSRLFDPQTHFFDGEGLRSVYYYPDFDPPIFGPDGYFHMTWVWRDTGCAATNHNISYARSRDLRTWVNAQGEPYTLPITFATSGIIDPVPPGGGLINPHQRIGFDLEGRVVVTYSKYDDRGGPFQGAFQMFNARLENGEWKHYQTTNWDYRWNFGGGGAITIEVNFGPVEIIDGNLTQRYYHIEYGNGRFLLDPETLRVVGEAQELVVFPDEIWNNELDFPGVGIRWTWDRNDRQRPFERGQTRYILRWESQDFNRDQPHPQTPPPSMLRVFRLRSSE